MVSIQERFSRQEQFMMARVQYTKSGSKDKHFAVFRGIYQNNLKTHKQNLAFFSSTSVVTLTFGDVSTEWEINSNQ